jgi:Fic family protein
MPGKFVKTTSNHDAFLPEGLPPKILWSDELISCLSAADRSLGRLAGIGMGNLGGVNPHLLIQPFMRREAVLSSQIEGTRATLSDLILFEQAHSIENEVPDVLEVSNYVQALEFGLHRLKIRPLSLGLLKQIHQMLMAGVRGADKTPGAFRDVQVVIGQSTKIDDARFVPPPPVLVNQTMEEFETYLQRPSGLPALVRLAMVHYQFEAIHPFQDGNGRIGRLLITLMVCSEGLLPLPMLYLSAYFEKHRQEYYDRLLQVSQRAAWTEWVMFFLRGVTYESADAIERAAKLMSLRDRYHAMVQTARSSALSIKLIDALFSGPGIMLRRATDLLGVTPAAAQNHIDRLVKSGILTEATNQKRNRVYLAREILNVLNEEHLPTKNKSSNKASKNASIETKQRQ